MLSHRNCNNSFISLVQYIRKYYGDVINGLIIHTIGITLLLVAVLLVLKPYIMRRVERKKLESEKQAALSGKPVALEGTTRWEKRYRPLVTALG